MILNIFLIACAVIALIVLGRVIWKKLPQLRILDPSSHPEEKTKQLKHEIIRQRVERAGSRRLKTVQKQVLEPVGSGLQNLIRRVAGKFHGISNIPLRRFSKASVAEHVC